MHGFSTPGGRSIGRVGSSLAERIGMVEHWVSGRPMIATRVVRLITASSWVESTPEGTIRT
jgi:hypothetical protein